MVRRPRGRRHRGVTLIEVSVSILLVASLGSLVVGGLVSRGRQQHSIDVRELAVVEAGNLMEQLTSLSWNDLTQERLAPLMLSDNFRQALPAATWELTVEPSTEKPEAKRIGIKIEYRDRVGQPVRPVRLTSWVYRIEPLAVAPPVKVREPEEPEDPEEP